LTFDLHSDPFGGFLFAVHKLFDCESDVFHDMAEQDGRDISTGMKREGGFTAIRMLKLFVGALFFCNGAGP